MNSNFRDWFGDSAITDDAGYPSVVYHGTSSKEPFDTFDAAKQGQTAGVGGGFFFTNRADVANDVYGWRSGGVVLKVFLKMENPLTLGAYLKAADDELGWRSPTNYFDEEFEKILAYAASHGHDGVLFADPSGDEFACDLYVVFDAGQIACSPGRNGDYLKGHVLQSPRQVEQESNRE